MPSSRHLSLALLALPALFASAGIASTSPDSAPPRTPQGLPSCVAPLLPASSFNVRKGEVIEYDLEIMGMDVGTLAFNIGREGTFEGAPVFELKTDLRVDRSLA